MMMTVSLGGIDYALSFSDIQQKTKCNFQSEIIFQFGETTVKLHKQNVSLLLTKVDIIQCDNYYYCQYIVLTKMSSFTNTYYVK